MYATRDLDRMYNETASLKRDRSRFVVHGAGFSQYHLSQTNGKPVRRADTNGKTTIFATEPTRTSKASLASAARKRRNDALLDARA
jgi:hypothetical protein